MHSTLANGLWRTIRAAGSMWFGAVLLVLLLMGMACATVFESAHGTEMALEVFYRSSWFKCLLAVLGVNLLAAVAMRYPFAKRHIGFVLTHLSILVILGGALVSARYGIDGQVGIAEGQTVREFHLPDVDALSIGRRGDSARQAVDLSSSAFRGFAVVDAPEAPVLAVADLRIEVLRYLPDSEASLEVVDDSPVASPAVEVSLSAPGHDHPTWVFSNRPATVGSVRAGFRVIHDASELARLIGEGPAEEPQSDGVVKIDYGGLKFEVPLSECLEKAVPLGDLGYTLRVLRYLPHATVGPDNKLVNVSNQPANPAVELELVGSDSTEKRLAFARFPDFDSMHGDKKLEGFKVTFVAPRSNRPAFPLEILSGPDGTMYARFSREEGEVVVRKISLGKAVDTPWPGQRFTVTRQFEHARMLTTLAPKEPRKKGRTPAIRVRLSTAEHSSEMWLQKYNPYPVTVDGVPYELVYASKVVPLGFALTLDSFKVGYYPGGMRPRSFESRITINDPTGGGTLSRVVSMNHPVKYGRYTLYQSSYRQDPGRTISYLSVARDPGLPIVFVGYIGVMLGMVVVLCTRMAEARRSELRDVAIGGGQARRMASSGTAATRNGAAEASGASMEPGASPALKPAAR